jgi:hypothetical protein
MQLNKREGELIRQTDNAVNRCIAGRTQKEWFEDNKDKIKQYYKEWCEDNKDKKKECDKQYREDNKERINKKYNCECGGKYTHKNKAKHFKTKKHIKYFEKS